MAGVGVTFLTQKARQSSDITVVNKKSSVTHYNWATLTYQHLWSFDGMVRHILFNGFHPVFPWTSFLVFGMWLGRLDLSQTAIRNQLLAWSVITLITTELGFYLLRIDIGDGIEFWLSRKEVLSLFSTSMIPPLPQYIISAGSSACIVLVGSLYFSDKFQGSKINIWLCQTGTLSLTLYVAHVILGMGVLDVIDKLSNQTIGFSLLSSLIFCICGVAFSVFWVKFFKAGPLEWLFRKVSC